MRPWRCDTSAMAGVLACLVGCTLGGPPSLEPRDSYPRAKETRKKSPTLTGLVVSTERFLDVAYAD